MLKISNPGNLDENYRSIDVRSFNSNRRVESLKIYIDMFKIPKLSNVGETGP